MTKEKKASQNKQHFDAKKLEEMKNKSDKFWKIIKNCQFESLDEKQKAYKELNISPSPKGIIYQENTLTLSHILSDTKKTTDPVIFVPSLINKNYIMDIIPGFSMIEYLTEKGVNAYMIDWGVPSSEHGALKLEDYVEGFIHRCVKRVLRHSKAKKVHIFGQCIGGIFTTLYSASHSMDNTLHSLLNLTVPINFEDAGKLSIWTNPKTFNLDKIVNSFHSQGVIPDDILHMGFPFLDVNLTFNKYKNLFNFSTSDDFVRLYRALDFWANDNVPFPAEAFRDFISSLYHNNSLYKGNFILRDKKVNLDNITIPVFNIIAEQDHVFPLCSASGWRKKLNKLDREEIFTGGHVSIVAALPVRFEIYDKIIDFIHKTQS